MSMLYFPGTRPPRDQGDGIATQNVPGGTVIELHGKNKKEIIEGVNRAVDLLAFDAEVLTEMVKAASRLCVDDVELVHTLSKASTAILLAEANKNMLRIINEAEPAELTQWVEKWKGKCCLDIGRAMSDLADSGC